MPNQNGPSWRLVNLEAGGAWVTDEQLARALEFFPDTVREEAAAMLAELATVTQLRPMAYEWWDDGVDVGDEPWYRSPDGGSQRIWTGVRLGPHRRPIFWTEVGSFASDSPFVAMTPDRFSLDFLLSALELRVLTADG